MEYMGVRQENNKWYKIDLILSWKENSTSLYVDGKYQTTSDFYHGVDKFHIAEGKRPEHYPSNSIVLYSLTSGSTSEFKNLKICEYRCVGGELLNHIASKDHDTDPD